MWICFMGRGKFIGVDEVPPEGCTHMFEHAVSESVNIDKTAGGVK
jgi:hypothetical protein